MGNRLIRISSRMTGERRWVRVYVYDTVEEMRAAGEAFNGNDMSDAWGMTHCYTRDGKLTLPIIRLCRESLGAKIVGHEIHHAASAIYSSTLPKRITTSRYLNHFNEVFAHLHSDLEGSLIDQLWAHGFYADQEEKESS